MQSEVVVFYTDFAKAFDRVPHYELLLKAGQIGIGGYLLEVLWLSQRTRTICPSRQHQIETFTSDNWGPTGITARADLILHIHAYAFRFGEPFMFADDLKILHIGTPTDQVQSNLDALEDWVTRNKTGLAIEKCAKVLFKGPESDFYLCGSLLQTSVGVKDLGIQIQSDLTRKIHLEERMMKANRVFYSLRNVAFKDNMRIKLKLYKWMSLPVLMYGSSCLT